MKLIGKGAFTKAYLTDNGKVLLKSSCPAKECSALGWMPESKMFPNITRVDYGIYEMEYLPKSPSLKTALKPRQYRLYKALRAMQDNLFFENLHCNDYQKFDNLHTAIKSLPSEFKNEKEKLQEAVDGLANYGLDICFEISPRNVRVKNGFLVLLDCFFFKSKLDEIKR